jgi:DnaJ-class molecular chaperone
MNAFEVLGLAPGASVDEIKKAYRRQAQLFHPDRNKTPGSEERFKLIKEAYEFLTTGKSSTKKFSSSSYSPPPASSAPPPSPSYSSSFTPLRTRVEVSFEEMMTSARVNIPGTIYSINVPYGITDGTTVQLMATADSVPPVPVLITFIVKDPKGFFYTEEVKGKNRLCCRVNASIGQLLAASTITIRNINPNLDFLKVKLSIAPDNLIEVPHAGLPLAKGRDSLFIHVNVVSKPLDQEHFHVLQELHELVGKEIQARKSR